MFLKRSPGPSSQFRLLGFFCYFFKDRQDLLVLRVSFCVQGVQGVQDYQYPFALRFCIKIPSTCVFPGVLSGYLYLHSQYHSVECMRTCTYLFKRSLVPVSAFACGQWCHCYLYSNILQHAPGFPAFFIISQHVESAVPLGGVSQQYNQMHLHATLNLNMFLDNYCDLLLVQLSISVCGTKLFLRTPGCVSVTFENDRTVPSPIVKTS